MARERVVTEREQTAAQSPDYGGDKLDVAIGDVVREAGRQRKQ